MSDLSKKIPIHQSLVQPVLVAGAEREVAILLGFLSLLIWIIGKDVSSIITSFVIWVLGMFLARLLARKDPQFIKVFFKHIKYRDFYPAEETIKQSEVKMKNSTSFTHLLNCFGFLEEGVLLSKDGSLNASFYFGGRDIDSSSCDERDSVCTQINTTLSKLQTGWTLNVDAIRVPVNEYPQRTKFFNSTMELLEGERQAHFENSGEYFETIHALTLTLKPSFAQQPKLGKLFVTKDTSKNISQNIHTNLEEFNKTLNDICSGFNGADISIKRMSSQEMFDFLHYCIRGKKLNLNVPNPPIYLDHALSYDFSGGLEPRIDGEYIGVVSLLGFPLESQNCILRQLTNLPFEYRFSSRFSILDSTDAAIAIRKVLVKQHNKQFSLKNMILSVLSPRSESRYGNEDALNKADDAHQAITEAEEGLVKYGYYTPLIIVIHKDHEECLNRLNQVTDLLNRSGFASRIDTVNTIEAYLGSLPSNKCNIRKPLIHTLNLAHLLPLGDIWTGFPYNPNPRLPEKSPSLFRAVTSGRTPINVNIHVSDVGHTAFFGPTGSGKSTILSLISKSFFRYPQAQVFQFDVNYSQYVFAKACGAVHYDLLNQTQGVSLCPLKNIDKSDEEMSWAAGWVEDLLILQGMKITAQERNAIRDALQALRMDQKKTLSNLYLNIQDATICEALEPFVSLNNGVMSTLLDGEDDSIENHSFLNFEIKNLLNRGQKYALPVLNYLFHRLDQRLDGRPTLIVLEEVWQIMEDERFAAKFSEWLRLLRAKNGAIVFAVHNIADLINSPLKDIIMDFCKTKIFLPNAEAGNELGAELYKKLGLNNEEVGIISTSIPKRQYYYTTPHGRRLIELELSKTFLRFVGKDAEKDKRRIRSLEEEYGESWSASWLCEVELHEQADKWVNIYNNLNQSGRNTDE